MEAMESYFMEVLEMKGYALAELIAWKGSKRGDASGLSRFFNEARRKKGA